MMKLFCKYCGKEIEEGDGVISVKVGGVMTSKGIVSEDGKEFGVCEVYFHSPKCFKEYYLKELPEWKEYPNEHHDADWFG